MRLKATAILLLGISVHLACGHPSGEWKGSRRIENGVLIIENPREPIQKGYLSANNRLSIGESGGTENSLFEYILSIAVDSAKNIYVLDSKGNSIKVFDHRGNYLRSFGRKGQGPGEFQHPSNMQCLDGKEIVVNDGAHGKVLIFSLSGQLKREIRPPHLALNTYAELDSGRNIILIVPRLSPRSVEIMKIRPPYEAYETIVTKSRGNDDSNPIFRLRFSVYRGDGLAWGYSDRYELNVMDGSGKIAKRIIKRDRPIKITEDYKKKYFESMPPSLRTSPVVFKTHFPAFDFFLADERGNIFVKTFEKDAASGDYIFDVFDSEGRYQARMCLPIGDEISSVDGKYMKANDELYTYLFNDEGNPFVRVFAIDDRALGH